MTNCDSCIGSASCIWCASENVCKDGAWFGPSPKESCDDWRWKQCAVNGKFPLIGSAALLGVILLFIGICLCKCFCCQAKRRKSKHQLKDFKDFKTLQIQEEKESLLGSKHPKTDQRRIELMQKYGKSFRSSHNQEDV